MKRFLLLLCVVAALGSLAGCSDSAAPDKNVPPPQAAPEGGMKPVGEAPMKGPEMPPPPGFGGK
jgi:hypothetical protein